MKYWKPTELKRKDDNMYVARDKCGDLCLFTGRPVKIDEYWQQTKHDFDWIRLDSELFPEVKCEDEEPTEVELVKKEQI